MTSVQGSGASSLILENSRAGGRDRGRKEKGRGDKEGGNWRKVIKVREFHLQP